MFQPPSGQRPQQLDQQVTPDGRIAKPEFASDYPTASVIQQVDWQAKIDKLLRRTSSIQNCRTSSAPVDPERPRSQAGFTMDQGKQFGSTDRIIQAPSVSPWPRHAPPLPDYDKIIRTDPVPVNPSDPSPFAKLAPVAFHNPASQMSVGELAWVRTPTGALEPASHMSNGVAVSPATPVSVFGNVKKRSYTFGDGGDNLPDNKKSCIDLTGTSPRYALPSETTNLTGFTPKLTAPTSLTGGGTSTLHSRPYSERPDESGKTFSFTANFTAPSLPAGTGTSTPPGRPWSGRPTKSGKKTAAPKPTAPDSLPAAVSPPSIGPGNYAAAATTTAQLASPAQQAISVPDQIKKLEAELEEWKKELSEKIKEKDKDSSNNAATLQRSGEMQNVQAIPGATEKLQAPASQALVPLEHTPATVETGEDAYARRVRMATLSSDHSSGTISATAPSFAVTSDGMEHLRLSNFLPLPGSSAPTHITDNVGSDVSVELQLEGSIMSDFTDLSACNSVQAFFVKIQEVLEHQLMGRDIAHVYVRFTHDTHERLISIPRDNHHAFDAMIRVIAAQSPGHKLFMLVQVVPKMPLALGAPTSTDLPMSSLA